MAGERNQISRQSHFTRYLTDTTNFQIPQSEYKVLVYVDSIGCTSCKLQLHKWKELIEYTDSATQGKSSVSLLFPPEGYKKNTLSVKA